MDSAPKCSLLSRLCSRSISRLSASTDCVCLPVAHGTVDAHLLGCKAVRTCKNIPTFRRNILPQSSGLRAGIHIQTHTTLQPRRWNIDFSITASLARVLIMLTTLIITTGRNGNCVRATKVWFSQLEGLRDKVQGDRLTARRTDSVQPWTWHYHYL
jgi:hypothetical protein